MSSKARMVNLESPFSRRSLPALDDFEVAILNVVAANLDSPQRDVLIDQVQRFNKVVRIEDERGAKSTSQFYWKRWFKARRDFPKVFSGGSNEERLATLTASTDQSGIEAQVWLVGGALFSIECTIRRGDLLRPLNPFFQIQCTSVFPDRQR